MELPDGHVYVRRVSGYGPAHLPLDNITIEEGGYWHLPGNEAYMRKDWDQVEEDDLPETEIVKEDEDGNSTDAGDFDRPVSSDSTSSGGQPGLDMGDG